jgi:hypothetical protein
MIAVLFQSGKLCKRLIVLTRKFCSSVGVESIGCPSRYVGALMKLTAGKDLDGTDSQNWDCHIKELRLGH